MRYYPIMEEGSPYKTKRGKGLHKYNENGEGKIEGYETKNNGQRFPRSVKNLNQKREIIQLKNQ
jgi:hypothetical protein